MAQCIRQLGLELVRHELLPVTRNPLNPTGLYLVRIPGEAKSNRSFSYQCPVSATTLQPGPTAYYSPDSMLAYPVLDQVPYLLGSHAILATQYQAGE